MPGTPCGHLWALAITKSIPSCVTSSGSPKSELIASIRTRRPSWAATRAISATGLRSPVVVSWCTTTTWLSARSSRSAPRTSSARAGVVTSYERAVTVDAVVDDEQPALRRDRRRDRGLDRGRAGAAEQDRGEPLAAAGQAHEALAAVAHHLEELGLAMTEIRRDERFLDLATRVRRSRIQQDPLAFGHVVKSARSSAPAPSRSRPGRRPAAPGARCAGSDRPPGRRTPLARPSIARARRSPRAWSSVLEAA